MSIADNLLTVTSNNKTVKDNVSKVYEAGQMNIIKTKASASFSGEKTLKGCLNEPIYKLNIIANGAPSFQIEIESTSGEKQTVKHYSSSGINELVYDGNKVMLYETMGELDVTENKLGQDIRALCTYAGNTVVTSNCSVSVGYYQDVRQAKYEEGEKDGKASESAKIEYNFKRSKAAVCMRGGEIDMNAEIDKLPDAILNIPIDASIGFYSDEDTAHQKTVPEGAEDYALLKQLGGMTYKCNNLLPYPYVATTHTNNGITFTDNGDGTITANGTATKKAYFKFYLPSGSTAFWTDFNLPAGSYYLSGCPAGGSASTYRITMSLVNAENTQLPAGDDAGKGLSFSISEDAVKMYFQIEIFEGVSVSNLTFKPMLNVGTGPKPFELYYEGLRDTKVTIIKSIGRNYLNFEAALKHWESDYEKAGNSYTIVNLNRAYSKPYVFTKNAGQYTLSVGGFEADETFLNTYNIKIVLGYYDGITFKNANTIHFVNGDKTITSSVNTPVNAIRFDWSYSTPPDSFKISEIRINKGAVDLGFDSYSEISHDIPPEIQSLNGYGKEGFVIDLENQTSEYEGNVSPLPVPLEPFIKVEGGGSIEFVNEHNNAVPSKVTYVAPLTIEGGN